MQKKLGGLLMTTESTEQIIEGDDLSKLLFSTLLSYGNNTVFSLSEEFYFKQFVSIEGTTIKTILSTDTELQLQVTQNSNEFILLKFLKASAYIVLYVNSKSPHYVYNFPIDCKTPYYCSIIVND